MNATVQQRPRVAHLILMPIVALVVTVVYASRDDTMAAEPASAAHDGTPYVIDPPLGLLNLRSFVPTENPLTREKVELGTLLFFDTRLSVTDTVACATCHVPALAFTDGQPVASGVRGRSGTRNVPTVVNRVYGRTQFWDGRAESLEAQAAFPVVTHVEMGMPSHEALVQKLNAIEGYRTMFQRVFGTDVTMDGIQNALAAFQRTILSGNSPVDRWKLKGDIQALSVAARNGMRVFQDKGRCGTCHYGNTFTDEKFHNLGVGWDTGTVDLGRYRVTKAPKDIGAFKTPTLRDVAHTAPYMHDGRFDTLEAVVDFYDAGGIENPFKDRDIAVLDLSDEDKTNLVAFLRSLSGEGWQQITAPTAFPR